MGRISIISKSRKEFKCSKCGEVIPKGTQYYRGTLNFHPDIIRCNRCKLFSWEVTTSDYVRQVGELVNTWQENYSSDEDGIEGLTSEIDDILEETQDKLDNMPEQLQESESGQTLQERIEQLECCINDLESIDITQLQNDIVKSYDDKLEEMEDLDYDGIMDSSDIDEYIKQELRDALSNAITEDIDDCLGNLEM